jgi:hypothetical protein
LLSNPLAYEVRNWFQSLLSNAILYRYSAVGELVSAVGGVVRTLAEHHGQHTDRDAAAPVDAFPSSSSACCSGDDNKTEAKSDCCPEPGVVEVVEEKKAGC